MPPGKPSRLFFGESLNALGQQTLIFLAPGTGFMEDNFSVDGPSGEMDFGWFNHALDLCYYYISIRSQGKGLLL